MGCCFCAWSCRGAPRCRPRGCRQPSLNINQLSWLTAPFQDPFPFDSSKKVLEEAQFNTPGVHGCDLTALLSPGRIQSSTAPWYLPPGLLPASTSPSSPSLFVGTRFSCTPLPSGSCTTRVRRFPSVLARSLLPCLCLAVPFLQQMSGWLPLTALTAATPDVPRNAPPHFGARYILGFSTTSFLDSEQ